MKTKHLKLIMELIFIFIIPLILICGTSTIEKTYVYDNSGNYQTSMAELSFDNSIIKYDNGYKNIINNFNILNDTIYVYEGSEFRFQQTVEYTNTNLYYYCGHGSVLATIYYMDANGVYQGDNVAVYGNTTFTLRNDYNKFVFIVSATSYGSTTYDNDICLNYNESWANGNYVPYGEPLILITSNDVSGQNTLDYTIWGNIKQLLINNLDLNESILLDLIICYTILWFLMFILWHFFYLVFDGLVHLFIDWKKRSD